MIVMDTELQITDFPFMDLTNEFSLQFHLVSFFVLFAFFAHFLSFRFHVHQISSRLSPMQLVSTLKRMFLGNNSTTMYRMGFMNLMMTIL